MPGELRRRDVKVGRHISCKPWCLTPLSRPIRTSIRRARKNRIDSRSELPRHHRLLWIHPFLDGNGRVARLMSHAMLLEVLDMGAIWSVARGLARNVDDYKARLAEIAIFRVGTTSRRTRIFLSEEALTSFTRFFLQICIDQVAFMEGLL